MVQPAGDVDRVLDLAVPQPPRGQRRAAGDERRRVVHAGEHRVVVGAEPEAAEGRVVARPAHGVQVVGVVDGEQLLLVGRLAAP